MELKGQFEVSDNHSDVSVDLDEEEKRHLSTLEVLKRIPDFETVFVPDVHCPSSPNSKKKRKKYPNRADTSSLITQEERDMLM